METLTLLKQLSEARGPSGREAPITRLLQDLWRPFCHDLRVDAMGNLIGVRYGAGPEPRRRLMLAAHMDEIGLIVTGLKDGFLHIAPIGGTDRRVLLGQPVVVHGKRDLPGIIGARPPHVLSAEERNKFLPWHKLYVDVGLAPEDVADLVSVGDTISIERSLIELKNGFVAGKALDNRASVAILTLALEALSRHTHTWDVYAVATVQEEVGTKGALTAAYGVAPDLAIALDCTFAQQNDDSGPGTYDMGKRVYLGIGPNFHPALLADLKRVAEREEIPVGLDPAPGHSGTDAWAIQVARVGVPTALVEAAVRYMHQPVETLALRDLERAARLLSAFAAHLEPAYQPTWNDAEEA